MQEGLPKQSPLIPMIRPGVLMPSDSGETLLGESVNCLSADMQDFDETLLGEDCLSADMQGTLNMVEILCESREWFSIENVRHKPPAPSSTRSHVKLITLGSVAARLRTICFLFHRWPAALVAARREIEMQHNRKKYVDAQRRRRAGSTT
jgi:hypothetical protein